MRRSMYAAFLSAVLLVSSSATVIAADTATPSAQPSLMAKSVKHVLTQAQKDAIAAARAAFATEKTDAQNGFNRALADARAIRDQAILAAGTDKNAIAIARKAFRDSYRIIMNAYKSDIENAKSSVLKALANAKALSKSP